MKRRRARVAALVLSTGCALLLPVLAPSGCSLGQGDGAVHSDALYARDCVLPTEGAVCTYDDPDAGGPDAGLDYGCDNYDLLPDFFAAVPSENTIQMRIQRGTDITELSDGIAVLVNDVDQIRAAIQAKRDVVMAQGATDDEALSEFVEVPVAMPLGVRTPGSPVSEANPCDEATQLCSVRPVAMALYLQKSCHNQNLVLYAVSGSIRFNSLWSADPAEGSAAEKLIYASSFDIVVGDPRDAPTGVPVGPDSIPPEYTSRLTGHFRFYFERGKPAQPF